MSGGRAHGAAREYQILCRDMLLQRWPGFTAYSEDGIDVPFDAGGTTWTMDVALRASGSDVLVAECRGRASPAKQEEVAAFAYKVELLRKDLGVPVAGAFIARSAPQLGAVKVTHFDGITMAVLISTEAHPGFTVVFHRYDLERQKRCRDFLLQCAPGHFRLTFGNVRLIVGRTAGDRG
jgi:hypothetical protein